MSRAAVFRTFGLGAIAAGVWLAGTTVPILTLTNRGLAFTHAPAAVLGGLLAAGGAFALALFLRPPRLRAGAALLALAFLGLGAQRALFRVEVGPERLSVRGLTGLRSVDWTQITRVLTPAGELVLEGRGGAVVRVPTASLPPEQQASLERAVARHVATAQLPEAPVR